MFDVRDGIGYSLTFVLKTPKFSGHAFITAYYDVIPKACGFGNLKIQRKSPVTKTLCGFP